MAINARRTLQPIDRLGRIAAAMTATALAHPEYDPGDRYVIMLLGELDGLGMSHMENYDDAVTAITDILEHLQAIASTAGLAIGVLHMPDDAGIEDL